MSISVKNFTGMTLNLKVSPFETILNVKNMIEEEWDIPPDRFRLIFGGKNLEEDKTLNFYSIQKDSGITLVTIAKIVQMQIFIEGFNGKTITLDVSSSDTI